MIKGWGSQWLTRYLGISCFGRQGPYPDDMTYISFNAFWHRDQENTSFKGGDLNNFQDIWAYFVKACQDQPRSIQGTRRFGISTILRIFGNYLFKEGKDQSITGGHDLQIIYCPLTQEFRIYMVSGWDLHHFQNIRSFSMEGGDHDNPMGNDLHINLCALTKGRRIYMYVV